MIWTEQITNKLRGSEAGNTLNRTMTPNAGKVVMTWILVFAVLGILFLFIPWTQTAKGSGQLTALHPEERPQTVHSNIPGRIAAWYVAEGEYVRAGDTIVRLAEVKAEYMDPEMIDRLKEQTTGKREAVTQLGEKIRVLQNQRVVMQQAMELKRKENLNKIRQMDLKRQSDSMAVIAAENDFLVAEKQFQRFESLYKEGLKSLTDLENRNLKLQQQKAKLTEARNKFENTVTQVEVEQLNLSLNQNDYMLKIQKIDSEINSARKDMAESGVDVAKLSNYLSSTIERNKNYYLLAPQDGYVVQALKTGIGEMIKEGEAIVTVQPDNPRLAVELFVDALDVPLLKPGTEVRLEFEGWPAIIFSGWPGSSVGTFGGRVAVIDYVNSYEGKYRILVVEDNHKHHWPEELRMGSRAFGWGLIGDVPIWYEVWRQLNGFPKDYPEEKEDAFRSEQPKLKIK